MLDIKIKICGIKNTATLDCCDKLSVDYCGLIFYKKSPRSIDVQTASNLINYLKKKKSIPVGVFVNYDFYDLIDLIKIIKQENIF